MLKQYRTEIKWAVIHCLMTLVWALIAKALGFHDEKIAYNLGFNTASLIPTFIIYVLALSEKRRVAYDGNMPYKKGVISGLVLTLFITILGPLTPLISIGVFSPDLFENLIRYTVSTNMMTEAAARSQLNMTAFIVQGIIAAPIFGLVFSLIAAAFLYKKRRIQAI